MITAENISDLFRDVSGNPTLQATYRTAWLAFRVALTPLVTADQAEELDRRLVVLSGQMPRTGRDPGLPATLVDLESKRAKPWFTRFSIGGVRSHEYSAQLWRVFRDFYEAVGPSVDDHTQHALADWLKIQSEYIQ